MAKTNKEEWIVAGNSGQLYNPNYESTFATFEKEGDKVNGIYKGVNHEVGKKKSDVYCLINEEEKVNISIWDTTVLKTKFSEIPVNSKIEVEFLGIPTGKEYKNFEVRYIPPVEVEEPAPAELKDEPEEIKIEDIPAL